MSRNTVQKNVSTKSWLPDKEKWEKTVPAIWTEPSSPRRIFPALRSLWVKWRDKIQTSWVWAMYHNGHPENISTEGGVAVWIKPSQLCIPHYMNDLRTEVELNPRGHIYGKGCPPSAWKARWSMEGDHTRRTSHRWICPFLWRYSRPSNTSFKMVAMQASSNTPDLCSPREMMCLMMSKTEPGGRQGGKKGLRTWWHFHAPPPLSLPYSFEYLTPLISCLCLSPENYLLSERANARD